MLRTLHLAAILLLTGAAATHAQITNPDALIAPPPTPPAIHHPTASTSNFQWLWQYVTPYNGHPVALTRDPRFTTLLRENLTAPQSFWRDGSMPLYQVAHRYFDQAISLNSSDNRYITLTGDVPESPAEQGFLWVDTAPPHPTLVFIARDWTTFVHPINDTHAEFNLWLFPNRQLDPDHLPADLVAAVTIWSLATPQTIHAITLVDPSGIAHKLDPSTFAATTAPTTTNN
jgi:hypothetical protein